MAVCHALLFVVSAVWLSARPAGALECYTEENTKRQVLSGGGRTDEMRETVVARGKCTGDHCFKVDIASGRYRPLGRAGMSYAVEGTVRGCAHAGEADDGDDSGESVCDSIGDGCDETYTSFAGYTGKLKVCCCQGALCNHAATVGYPPVRMLLAPAALAILLL